MTIHDAIDVLELELTEERTDLLIASLCTKVPRGFLREAVRHVLDGLMPAALFTGLRTVFPRRVSTEGPAL